MNMGLKETQICSLDVCIPLLFLLFERKRLSNVIMEGPSNLQKGTIRSGFLKNEGGTVTGKGKTKQKIH